MEAQPSSLQLQSPLNRDFNLFGSGSLSHVDQKVMYETIPHSRLVHQGRAWGRHLTEPWQMLVIAAGYILISVGFGLPICGLISDAICAIVFSILNGE